MDYNEYDSNGNKKKFNILDLITNKTQRSRFYLLIYLVLFIILIVFIRLNISSSLNNNSVNEENTITNENKEIEKENTVKEEIVISNDMFSFIDLNNYNFVYNVSIGNSISYIEGRRFNDKFSFTLNNDGYILYFNGTKNYIKARESEIDDYKLTGFPYVLVNYFDIDVLKNLINKSKINNDKYEITNEEISKIVKYGNVSNKEAINTIELIKNNNKVTQINLNFSNVISDYLNENVDANITLKYSNFGLIDDFKVE